MDRKKIGGANRRVDRRGGSEGGYKGGPNVGTKSRDQAWGPSLGTKSGDQVWGTCLLYRFLSVFINLDKFAIEGSDSAWMRP